MTATQTLPDGSMLTVTPFPPHQHVVVDRRINGETVWAQVLAVRPDHPDEFAQLADWIRAMSADPSAFIRPWKVQP